MGRPRGNPPDMPTAEEAHESHQKNIACQDLAIVAGSDHFIRRLLHEPDKLGVLPDNGGAGWF
jgi:hypothetical protein